MSNGLDPAQYLTIVGLISPRAIAVETSGSLIVVDGDLRAVTRFDQHTGQASLVSGATTTADWPFMDPVAIAVEPNGRLAVVDAGRRAVIGVERNGNRSIVSNATTGAGPRFERPVAIAVEPNGRLAVVDAGRRAVIGVERNGNRSIVSDATTGAGPRFERPAAIAVEANGALIVVDRGLAAVCRVDPVSGDRRIVSGCTALDEEGHCTGALIGQGPTLVAPVGIAVEAGGALVVVDTILGSRSPGVIIRVNPANGDRTIVSDATSGDGPPLDSPWGIAREANGTLVVVDPRVFSLGAAPPALFRVHPHTGNRTLVAQGATGRGSGPLLKSPWAIAREANGALAVGGGERGGGSGRLYFRGGLPSGPRQRGPQDCLRVYGAR